MPRKITVEKIDKEDKFFVQSLHRAFQIIEKISESKGKGLSATEISKGIGLHVSTVYRLLQNLVAWNYATENSNGNYTLGIKFLELGYQVQNSIEIRNVARKHLEELNELTKETIYLAIFDDKENEILYIEKMPSQRRIALVAGIGSRNYVHSTANGKCLLSGFSNERILQILKKKGMPAVAKNTITDPAKYLQEIEKVRELKYAVDDLENEDSVRCVSSPIYDYRKSVVAAVSISGVTNDIDDALMHGKYRELVINTAQAISKELGYHE